MDEKKRLNLSFSMYQPQQRRAWRILSRIPAGQRTDFIFHLVLENQRDQQQVELLNTVRMSLREELESIREKLKNYTPQESMKIEQTEESEAEDVVDENVLGFLFSLQNGGD